MSRIAVDPDRLADFVERLRFVQAELDAARDGVADRIRADRTDWAGSAAAAHEAAHNQWQAGAREVQDALAALHAIVRTAQVNYAAAIDANRRVWRA